MADLKWYEDTGLWETSCAITMEREFTSAKVYGDTNRPPYESEARRVMVVAVK